MITINTSPAPVEQSHITLTDSQGRYTLTLRPGSYTVRFRLPGFRTVVREGVEVSAQLDVSVDAELTAGLSIGDRLSVSRSGVSPTPDLEEGILLNCEVTDGTVGDCRRSFVGSSIYR